MATIFSDIQVNLSRDFAEFLEGNRLKDELKKVCDESDSVMTSTEENGIKIQGNLVSILKVHEKLDELRKMREEMEGKDLKTEETDGDKTDSDMQCSSDSPGDTLQAIASNNLKKAGSDFSDDSVPVTSDNLKESQSVLPEESIPVSCNFKDANSDLPEDSLTVSSDNVKEPKSVLSEEPLPVTSSNLKDANSDSPEDSLPVSSDNSEEAKSDLPEESLPTCIPSSDSDSDLPEDSLPVPSYNLKECYVSLTRLDLGSIVKLANSTKSYDCESFETDGSTGGSDSEHFKHSQVPVNLNTSETDLSKDQKNYTTRSKTSRSPRRRWNKEAMDVLLHTKKSLIVKSEPQSPLEQVTSRKSQRLQETPKSVKSKAKAVENAYKPKSKENAYKPKPKENAYKPKPKNKKKHILYVKTMKRKPNITSKKYLKKTKSKKDTISSQKKPKKEKIKVEKEAKCDEDIIFKCEYCTYENLRKSNLTEHVRRAHKLDQDKVYREFPCDICGKIFGYERDVRRHQMLRHGIKDESKVKKTEVPEDDESIRVKCEYCAFTAIKVLSMKEHTRRCHPELCDKKFQCDTCGRIFGYSRDLNRHIMTHRSKELRLLNRPTEYKCKHCPYTAKKQTNLSEHIRRTHYDITQKVFECIECDKKFGFRKDLGRHAKTHERKRERLQRKLTTVYSCNYCIYIGKSQSHLNAHVRRKHMDITKKEFPCPVCDKRFGYPKELKRHMVRHEDPTIMCEECGAMFKCQRTLKYHLMTNHNPDGATRYACKLCSKSFSQEGYLNGHIKKVHLGIRDVFLCQICGKSFLKKISYINHTNVHLGKKPFVCEVCGKSFAYQKSIIEHRYIHSNLKPFHCTTCSKSFRFASGLYKHRKNRHGAFQSQKGHICRNCGKCFSDKNSLHVHEKVHRGFEPWLCKFCGQSFKSSSSARRHLILTHSIENDECEKHLKKILYSSTGRFVEEVNTSELTEDFFKSLKNPLKFNAIPSKDNPLASLENVESQGSAEQSDESDDSRHSTNNFIIEIPKSTFTKMQSLEKINIDRKRLASASGDASLEKELMEMACAAAAANVLKPVIGDKNEEDEEDDEEPMEWSVEEVPVKRVEVSNQDDATNTIQLEVSENGVAHEDGAEPSPIQENNTEEVMDDGEITEVTVKDEARPVNDHQLYSLQNDSEVSGTSTEKAADKNYEPQDVHQVVMQTEELESHEQNHLQTDERKPLTEAEIAEERVAEAAKVLTILNEECSKPLVSNEQTVETTHEEVRLVTVNQGAEQLLTESILAASALEGDQIITYQSDDVSNEGGVQHIVYTTDGVIGTSNSQEIILSEANIDGQVVYIVSGDIEGLT